MKRVRAAPRNAQVEHTRLGGDGVAHRFELRAQRRVRCVHGGVQLDHALGDLGLYRSWKLALLQPGQEVRGVARQVLIVRPDELKLELYTDAEGWRRHAFPDIHQYE